MNKLLLTTFGLLLFLPNLTLATSGTFTTYPSFSTDHSTWIVRDVNPGQQYEDYITIENLSDDAINLNIETVETSGTKEDIEILDNGSLRNLGLWITPDQKTLTLNAHQKQNIRINIDIPKDAPIGETQGAIMVSNNEGQAGQINTVTRIGNRIYLNVTNSQTLQANTLAPSNHILQIGLIILSLSGLIYGISPTKKLTTQKI